MYLYSSAYIYISNLLQRHSIHNKKMIQVTMCSGEAFIHECNNDSCHVMSCEQDTEHTDFSHILHSTGRNHTQILFIESLFLSSRYWLCYLFWEATVLLRCSILALWIIHSNRKNYITKWKVYADVFFMFKLLEQVRIPLPFRDPVYIFI